MNSRYLQLVKDTVTYLRQEGFLLAKTVTTHPPPKSLPLYHAQEDFVNLDLARQSQIDTNEEHHSRVGKGDEEGQFGKVGASQNSPKLTEGGIKPKPKSEPIILQKPALEKKRESSPLLFDAIQKHLPHIHLSREIPKPKQVAILISDEKDLPFLKNLARAIQERLCGVKLLREENGLDLQAYSLVLSQKKIEGISQEKQILLAKASSYQNNTSEKQNLWEQICRLLKSS